MCINLCNEQLQKQFVAVVIDSEMEVYSRELSKPIKINYEKNDDTLAALYGKPKSKSANIFSILDDVTKNKSAEKNTVQENANNFLTTVTKFSKEKESAKRVKVPRKIDNCFIVDHYAASVNYDIKEWVEKNADKLPGDVYKCLESSHDAHFISETYYALNPDHMDKKTAGAKTIAASFKKKLTGLAASLNACDCQFVRCIKTNAAKVKEVFEEDLVLSQLAYTGMLATLNIRRQGYPLRMFQTLILTLTLTLTLIGCQGYPLRMSQTDFVDKYGYLMGSAKKPALSALISHITSMIPALAKGVKGKLEPYLLEEPLIQGKTMVLGREWLVMELAEARRKLRNGHATTLQSVFRATNNRVVYKQKELKTKVYSKLCEELKYFLQLRVKAEKTRLAANAAARAKAEREAQIAAQLQADLARVAKEAATVAERESAGKAMDEANVKVSKAKAASRWTKANSLMKGVIVTKRLHKFVKSTWCMEISAAASILRVPANSIAWVAVTWEAPGEMGMKMLPLNVLEDGTRKGARVSAVRLGMPDKLKSGCIFGALNGEIVLDMDYGQIMSRLKQGIRPLTIQFLTKAPKKAIKMVKRVKHSSTAVAAHAVTKAELLAEQRERDAASAAVAQAEQARKQHAKVDKIFSSEMGRNATSPRSRAHFVN